MISDLWDHSIALYAPSDAESNVGGVRDVWTAALAAPADANARVTQGSLRLIDWGPGETPEGVWVVSLDTAVPASERWGVDVVAGPEAPLKLRVVSAGRPNDATPLGAGHHQKLLCVLYNGSFT